MRITLIIALYLIFGTFDIFAQSQKCATALSFKGDITIITQECDNFQDLFPSGKMKMSSSYMKLMLTKTSKSAITLALNKGVNWAQINQTKGFVFKKRVVEVDAQATTSYKDETVIASSSGYNGNSYQNLEIVFEAISPEKFRIIIYGDMRQSYESYVKTKAGNKLVIRKQAFDIDMPGAPLLTLNSIDEVNQLVSLLDKQGTDLNSIFK